MQTGAEQAAGLVHVLQDGARGHYGLPTALAMAGILGDVFTDFYCRPGTIDPWMARLVRLRLRETGRRMLERRGAGVPAEKVRFSYANLIRQIWGQRSAADGDAYNRWRSSVQAEWVLRHDLSRGAAMVGFVRSMRPQFAREVRSRGLLMIADQAIAPAAIERQERVKQHERFPGWEPFGGTAALDEWDRIEREIWANCDQLTTPSAYVRDGLISVGVPASKVTNLFYPINESSYAFVDRRGRRGPVTVGCVGTVSLRKGTPYFLEMAKRFDPAKVRFVLVGPSVLNPDVLARHQGHVDVRGSLPRSEAAAVMRQFDLVYFPTTCEGSAYALMESMSTGLPIVTSPNSGTVGRHEREAFLSAYDELDVAESYIRRLVDDAELRWSMGEAANARYQEFSLARYSVALKELVESLLSGAGRSDAITRTS